MAAYVIAYDIGTTNLKTSLFKISSKEKIQFIDGKVGDYDLTILPNGGVEQDPLQWWEEMCKTTKALIESTRIPVEEIQGISFCAQMQTLILVDKDGNLLRNSMSCMDTRGKKQFEKGMAHGLKVEGLNAGKLVRSVLITGAVCGSAKDPVWKYNWIRENEPEVFKKIYKWLDAKDYLVCRMTGEFKMSEDSAYLTLLYDSRPGKKGFSKAMCKMLNVDYAHLPEVCKSTDRVGGLTEKAAAELGLLAGTPVFSGGGDVSLTGVGAGAVLPGDTHAYVGTSGWMAGVIEKQKLDVATMVASVIGVNPKNYVCIAEMETAGKCLEWARDRIGLDEIGLYRDYKYSYQYPESIQKNIYDYMMDTIKDVPAGSRGVIFTPWLHGERCPFEDGNARGMFFNLGLEDDERTLIHAVIEGICLHLRWQLVAMEKLMKTSATIKFVGGGALSPLTCQILADILNRRVETIENPQNVGAVGAAAVIAVGLGLAGSIEEVKDIIPIAAFYEPNPENVKVYDKIFPVFQSLYKNNKKAFAVLNEGR